MQKCPNCQAELNDGTIFCTVCGAKLPESSPAIQPNRAQTYGNYAQPQSYQQQSAPVFQPAAAVQDNRKTYSILSYIGILWLFGLCAAPEKYDPRVRFNVGQGIILSITNAALAIVAIILASIFKALFTTTSSILGYTYYSEPSAVGVALISIVWFLYSAITVFYAVYGIVKVCKNQDAYLPIIGKMSFYK